MSYLDPLSQAPDFELRNAAAEPVKLSDYLGKKHVVLYFYPKDDTPGCTREAIDFTRLGEDFAAADTVVMGVSKDSCQSHEAFAEKHDLNVILLSDEDHVVQELYGAWQEKNNYGKKYMGTARCTYLIDTSGTIQQLWKNVKVDGHAEQVLAAARALGA